MRARFEKCLHEIKLGLPAQMAGDLKALARANGFDSVSPYIRMVLQQHLHGRLSGPTVNMRGKEAR